MNGIKYLVDTNCFIYLLSQNPLIFPFTLDEWAFCYITEIELLSKRTLDANDDLLIREMLSDCYKVEHTQLITDLTIKLRRNYNLKLPDAIIAASAQSLNIPLLTADKAFEKVNDIDSIILNF